MYRVGIEMFKGDNGPRSDFADVEKIPTDTMSYLFIPI